MLVGAVVAAVLAVLVGINLALTRTTWPLRLECSEIIKVCHYQLQDPDPTGLRVNAIPKVATWRGYFFMLAAINHPSLLLLQCGPEQPMPSSKVRLLQSPWG